MTPSHLSHRRSHVLSPHFSWQLLETFIASFFSLYLIQIQNFIFFPSSFIQPASERRRAAGTSRPIFHHHQASSGREHHPEDFFQRCRRVVLTSRSYSLPFYRLTGTSAASHPSIVASISISGRTIVITGGGRLRCSSADSSAVGFLVLFLIPLSPGA